MRVSMRKSDPKMDTSMGKSDKSDPKVGKMDVKMEVLWENNPQQWGTNVFCHF